MEIVRERCERDCRNGSDDLFDETAAQAPRTNADALTSATDERVNALEVRALDLLRLDVRVADFVTDQPTFVTNGASVRHG